MIQLQLNLFKDEISEDWIFNYLITNYPDMKFIKTIADFNNRNEIVSTISDKADVRVSIVNKNNNDKHWCRKFDYYISLDLRKKYGDYEGWGYGVDTIDEFKSEIERFILRAREFIEEYKNKKRTIQIEV